MANHFHDLSTGRGEHADSRSPQSKGKPAHRTAHGQVGRGRVGPPANVPNRSGQVKSTLGKKRAARG